MIISKATSEALKRRKRDAKHLEGRGGRAVGRGACPHGFTAWPHAALVTSRRGAEGGRAKEVKDRH